MTAESLDLIKSADRLRDNLVKLDPSLGSTFIRRFKKDRFVIGGECIVGAMLGTTDYKNDAVELFGYYKDSHLGESIFNMDTVKYLVERKYKLGRKTHHLDDGIVDRFEFVLRDKCHHWNGHDKSDASAEDSNGDDGDSKDVKLSRTVSTHQTAVLRTTYSTASHLKQHKKQRITVRVALNFTVMSVKSYFATVPPFDIYSTYFDGSRIITLYPKCFTERTLSYTGRFTKWDRWSLRRYNDSIVLGENSALERVIDKLQSEELFMQASSLYQKIKPIEDYQCSAEALYQKYLRIGFAINGSPSCRIDGFSQSINKNYLLEAS